MASLDVTGNPYAANAAAVERQASNGFQEPCLFYKDELGPSTVVPAVFHLDEERRFRDFRRDNEVVAAGESVLRYGWPDVTAHPCAVAAQVAGVLQTRGWTGLPKRCGPG